MTSFVLQVGQTVLITVSGFLVVLTIAPVSYSASQECQCLLSYQSQETKEASQTDVSLNMLPASSEDKTRSLLLLF